TNDAGLNPGTYALTYNYAITVQPSGVQCKNSDVIKIRVQQPPAIRISTRDLKNCADDSLFILNLEANPAPYSFKWQHFGAGHFIPNSDITTSPTYVRDSAIDVPAGVVKIK